METFNIFSQVQSELKDFFEKKVKIGSAIIDVINKSKENEIEGNVNSFIRELKMVD